MEPRLKWDLEWRERPQEEARNFNPAFCAELFARTVAEYMKARKQPFGIAIAFLILPLTLHKETRDALPGRANTAFAGWVAENSETLVELPIKVKRMRPVSREALVFSIHHQILEIESGGLLFGKKPIPLSAKPSLTTDDANEARSAAALLGRWFALQSQSAILQGMGVSP